MNLLLNYAHIAPLLLPFVVNVRLFDTVRRHC